MAPTRPDDQAQYDLHSERELHFTTHPHRARDTEDLTCKDTIEERVLFPTYQADSGPISTDNILGAIRDRLCGDSKCTAPAGFKKGAVLTATDPEYSKCEITIGLDGGIEAYAFRQTDPVDELKQECIDSVNKMITTVHGDIKECWMIGDHEYQMYQAGFRALNARNSSSLHISQGKTISSTLPSIGLPAINTTATSSKDTALTTGDDPDKQTPMVAGIVIGALALVVLTVVLFCCHRRRKKEKARRARKEARRAARSANSSSARQREEHTHTRSSSRLGRIEQWINTTLGSTTAAGSSATRSR